MNPAEDIRIAIGKFEAVIADQQRRIVVLQKSLEAERAINHRNRNQPYVERILELRTAIRSFRCRLDTMTASRDKWRARALYRANSEGASRLQMMLEEDKRRAALMDDGINPKVPSSLGSWLKEETCQTGSAFRRNVDGQTHVEGHNCPSC